MVLKIFLVLASSIIALADLTEQCPPPESIACQCTSYSFGSMLRCDRVLSLNAFQDILKALKGYKVRLMQVAGVNTSMLSTDLFQGLHIESLSLSEVRADDTSLGHSHFLGLENSLKNLRIAFAYGRTSSLSSVRLDHLHSLKEVRFSLLGNREFGNDWFKGPKNLEEFAASVGRLEKLGDKTFASLTNLKQLWLSHNYLEEISRSMLPYPASHLEFLSLSENKIRTLPSDIFSGMPVLTEVDLQNNLIQALPEGTWSPVFSKLRPLFPWLFEGNPLRCDEDLKWACDVNVDVFSETKCASPDDKRGVSVQEFCRA